MRPILRRTALAALALAAACSSTDPNRYVRELGFLQLHESPIEVAVPQAVRAGEEFTISVVTRGGGCTNVGDTETTGSGTTVDVRPYDLRIEGPDVACPDILRGLTHQVPWRFDAPGTYTVRVHGRREPQMDVITVTRTVTVQPAG
jgi:hypothetical protein